MCRNIKTLFNFEPPATDEEIRAASLQFVRKLSGFNTPSKANEEAFERAVDEVAGRRAGCSIRWSPRAAARPRGRGRQGARPQRRALRPGLTCYRRALERIPTSPPTMHSCT